MLRGFPSTTMIITKGGGGGKGKGGKRGAQHPLTKMSPFFPPFFLSVCLSLSRARRRVQKPPTNFGEIIFTSLREKSEREFSERGRRCYRRRRRTLLDIHHHLLRDNAVMMMIIVIIIIIIAGFFRGDRQKQCHRLRCPPPSRRPNGKQKSSGFSSCGRWFYSSPTSPSLSLL